MTRPDYSNDSLNLSWGGRSERDLGERHPLAPRRPVQLDARGTVARQFIQHGADCTCRWCAEQPETEAALHILRRQGLL